MGHWWPLRARGAGQTLNGQRPLKNTLCFCTFPKKWLTIWKLWDTYHRHQETLHLEQLISFLYQIFGNQLSWKLFPRLRKNIMCYGVRAKFTEGCFSLQSRMPIFTSRREVYKQGCLSVCPKKQWKRSETWAIYFCCQKLSVGFFQT